MCFTVSLLLKVREQLLLRRTLDRVPISWHHILALVILLRSLGTLLLIYTEFKNESE